EVRSDGLWSECTCETPFEHWTYGLEAFAVRLDSPGDALRGEIGERLPLGFDLEWEVLSPVMASSASRYEQAGVVHGEVLIGRERIEFQGHGMRSHGWDAEPWVAPWAAASFQSGDAYAVSVNDAGCVWRGGDEIERLATVELGSQSDDEGLPTSARLILDGEEIDVDLGGMAVVPLEGYTGRASRLVRVLCRFAGRDGTESLGWAEWVR
ncbi:MAG: hypothetical protein QOI55_2810, partial [Actinomycetota bacterium]|nr:hypothetical protein [Actinomycetota bacterium]